MGWNFDGLNDISHSFFLSQLVFLMSVSLLSCVISELVL